MSDAVEDVTIENKEPEAYLMNLKESMQAQPVRVSSFLIIKSTFL